MKGAVSLTAVLDDAESVSVHHLSNGGHVGGLTEDVDG